MTIWKYKYVYLSKNNRSQRKFSTMIEKQLCFLFEYVWSMCGQFHSTKNHDEDDDEG